MSDTTKKEKIPDWKAIFSIGYYCACSVIASDHGTKAAVKEALVCNFMDIETMREIGVNEGDIEILKPLIEELQQKDNPEG